MKTGIIISNLGTPTAPTPKAVRQFLREFLSDTRVIEIPPLIWWFILNGIILTIRPQKVAKNYQKIWFDEGSPLAVYQTKLVEKLQQHFDRDDIIILNAMRYGEPSITQALRIFDEANVDNIIVLPLYPQYSATTTATTFDAVFDHYKQQRRIPTLQCIQNYHDFPPYIDALAKQIQTHWATHGKKHLVLSYHGLPKRCVAKGDPYQTQCEKTTEKLIKQLQLNDSEYTHCYQSRFGAEKWLTPYAQDVFRELPEKNITDIDVFCPGFAVDCLETLEEIAIQNKALFLEHGGNDYHYIPALNANASHVQCLATLLDSFIHKRGVSLTAKDAIVESHGTL